MNWSPTSYMKTKPFLLLLPLLALCVSVAGLALFRQQVSATEGNYRCRVMEVAGGYGYVVTSLPTGDTLIVQPYVPSLGGCAPFATKRKALETGRLVCRKLSQGEPPTLSREEVWEITGKGKQPPTGAESEKQTSSTLAP